MSTSGSTPDASAGSTEQQRWQEQWAHFRTALADQRPLLERWLAPVTLAELRGLDVLDAGCGNGTHTAIYAEAGARSVRAVDYASWQEASERWRDLPNVTFGFYDLCGGPPEGTYDLIACVGVLPHVPDARRAIANLASALRPGGRLVIWATVREGNTGLLIFDRAKLALTSWGGARAKRLTAQAIELATRPAQALVTRSPRARDLLPYGRYIEQLAGMTHERATQNFYDALNAPRRILFRADEVTGYFRDAGLEVNVHIPQDGKSRTWVGRRAP
jgi:2-polyprenyl-3-methyl-5-hydroxy-6-metoxy-1,4-benzoquinol methylase